VNETFLDSARAESELARQLATLALSGVRGASGSALQAAVWWNGLLRLGLAPPLVVVHDLGLLLAGQKGVAIESEAAATQRGGFEVDSLLLGRYRALLEAVAASETRAALDAIAVRDEVVVVLLARLLGDVFRRWAAGARLTGLVPPLPLVSPLYTRPAAELALAQPPKWALALLRMIVDEQAGLLVRLEQIEIGAFRLLGLFPPGATPELADLYQLATTIGAGQIADFSLQLMPSLLETKRSSASQSFALDGYASVERRGSVDALLPTEVAHDSEIFAQRALSEELLYYGHERPHEGVRRAHGILIDASASMRGAREVFARGLGLALAKKLALLGGEVWLSFFDSRLYRRVEASALGGRELPYLLCFRSEQGRNYARVFADLRDELQHAYAAGGATREVSITFITHGECHIPTAVVQAIRRQAALYGIFVLPSQPLELEYLPLLSGHQVITTESVTQPAEKRRRALEVVGDVAATVQKRPAARDRSRR
jgi:hypothetical protein